MSTSRRLLLVALETACKEPLFKMDLKMDFVEVPLDFEVIMDNPLNPPPVAIICGAPEPVNIAQLNETAQLLRTTYPDCPIFLLLADRKDFHRKDFQKNGFTDAFLLHNDGEIFAETLKFVVSEATKGEVKFFKSVNLVDITPETVLGFDLYLYMPSNGKHVKFASGTHALDKKRAARLATYHVQTMQITTDQVQSFYKFTAEQLRSLGNGSGLSLTEQKEKRERAIRNLLTGLFHDIPGEDGFDKGREIVTDCKAIVKTYISQNKEKAAWYERLMASVGGQNSFYSRAANVSTYCSLFSIGLGIGDPEEMAIAGLLYHIGLADIPAEIVTKPPHERSAKERELFATHPEKSLDMIKRRKIILSESVLRAIEQHHERFDGTGFPRGLAGDRICKEAQLLAFADWFDEITAGENLSDRSSPAQAIKNIYERSLTNASDSPFDPNFLKQVLSLFPKQDENTNNEAAS